MCVRVWMCVRVFLRGLQAHLLVELEPGDVTLAVGVLETKEPDLPQAHCLHHLETHTSP